MFRSIGLRDEAAIVGQQPRRCPESGVQKFGKDAEIAARAGCRSRAAKGEAMQAIGEKTYCFAGFTLDLRRGSLRSGNAEIELRPKSFMLLRYLVENSGRLVSRDELIKALWPDVIATDESVTRCVSDVRMALGDSAQRIIKTLSKRGYVLAASVFEPGVPSQSDAATRAVATSSDLPSASPGERPAERRQLTVLSCKVVGLTAVSARLDPEDLRMVTAACHRYCAEILHRHGGYLARYHSDGVVAYFGYPQAAEHDAENAVRAGLALVTSAATLAETCGAAAELRIGIATGLVVIGDEPVTGEANEPTAVGETPDLAGWLQNAAKAGGVVVAETTRRLVGGLFDYHDLGHLPAEGSAEPMPARARSRAASRRCARRQHRSSGGTKNSNYCYGAGDRRRPAEGEWCCFRANRGSANRALPPRYRKRSGVSRTRGCAISARRTTRTARSTRSSASSNAPLASGARTASSGNSATCGNCSRQPLALMTRSSCWPNCCHCRVPPPSSI